MKKLLISLTILAVAATAALVAIADDAVYSVNTVSVIKYTIPANGELTCVSLPLNPLDTSDDQGRWIFGDTAFCDQLAVGSSVYFWTGTAWSKAQKRDVAGEILWTGGVTNRVIKTGEALFVKGPADGAAQVISMVGELPTDDSLSYTLTGSGNLDTRAVSLYPVEVTFGDTELAESLDVSSSVYFWTGTAWSKAQKRDVAGDILWTGGVTNRTVGIGEGVFVKSSGAASTITQERPFEWE